MMSQEDIVGALAAPSRPRRFTPLTPHGLPRPPRSPGFSDAGSSVFPSSRGGSSITSPRSDAGSSILSPRSVVSSNTSYSTSSGRSYYHRFDPMSPNPTAFSIPSFVSVIDLDGGDGERRLAGSSSISTRANHYRNRPPKSLGIDVIKSTPPPLLLNSAFSPLHSPKVPKLKRLGMKVKSAFRRTRRPRDLSYGDSNLWGDDDDDEMEYERIETVHWTEQ